VRQIFCNISSGILWNFNWKFDTWFSITLKKENSNKFL